LGTASESHRLWDVLAVELPVHQHAIDVDHFLGRIREVLDDF